MVRLTLARLGRVKQYFIRGHTTLGISFTLLNTLGIWYGLIPGVRSLFSNSFALFAVVFIPMYVVSMMLFGLWDMKRGTYSGELLVGAYYSPAWQVQITLLAYTNWGNAQALEYIAPYISDVQRKQELLARVKELKNGNNPPS